MLIEFIDSQDRVAGSFFMAGLVVYFGSFFIKGQASPAEAVRGPATQDA